ncbi:GNAT family N-acetyltransferase [Curtobacterium sp. 458]|uniref:GNAT family N-acetyltransferase n=1 Tax=Curtobacterium sp. 458 TaxID=3050069 RepID=UPI0025B59335|nr:GNAT family N-acetyltransferase [Curtobacterium sp. 458]WJY00399.1 GNAT family N-acetyltransferase [Curtobacterium sp. 458]
MDTAPKPQDAGADRVSLRALTDADVAAHNAGEDDQTIRWLSGAPSTTLSTRRHFEMLARNARRGAGKRGFGVLLDGELAGYIDFDPDANDLPEPGDVNIAYAVHPWARRQGVATVAIRLLCARLEALGVGRRAIIRAETDNDASVTVARNSGFVHLGDFPALGETGPGGEPVVYSTFGRPLTDTSS